MNAATSGREGCYNGAHIQRASRRMKERPQHAFIRLWPRTFHGCFIEYLKRRDSKVLQMDLFLSFFSSPSILKFALERTRVIISC